MALRERPRRRQARGGGDDADWAGNDDVGAAGGGVDAHDGVGGRAATPTLPVATTTQAPTSAPLAGRSGRAVTGRRGDR